MYEYESLYSSSARMELDMALLRIPDEDIVKTEYHLFAYDQSKDTSDISDEEDLTSYEPNCMIDDHPYVATRLSSDLQYEREKLLYKEFSKDLDRSMGIGSIWGLLMVLVGGIIASLPLIMALSTCLEEGTAPMTAIRALFVQANIDLLVITAIGVLIVLGGILRIILAKRGERKAEKEPEVFAKPSKKWGKLKRSIDKDLGIPEGAERMDILPYNYKVIGGEIHEYLSNHAHENINAAVWREGDLLCLSDHFSTVRVPISAVKGYVTVKEKCRISDWWKDEPHNSASYELYRIIEEKSGCYLMDSYVCVTVDVPEGETTRPYLLRLPAYDLPVLQKFISLPYLDGDGKGA